MTNEELSEEEKQEIEKRVLKSLKEYKIVFDALDD